MTTSGAGPEPVFVDTNVLIYAAVPSLPEHRAAYGHLDALDRAGTPLWISRQVLREYLAVLSKPGVVTPQVPRATLIADVWHYQQLFRIAEDGPAVTAELLALISSIPSGGKQIHDANLVATMKVHGLRKLLTHNVGDFVRFAPSIDVLPIIP